LRRALLAVGMVLLGGTIGMMLIEHTDFLSALMNTISMMSTEGGDIHPVSPAGQVLMLFVLVLGIGSFFYLLGSLAEYVLEGHLGYAVGRRHMENRIARLRDHAIICGFGRVGRRIARELAEWGQEFVVVDIHEESAPELTALGYLHLIGDATQDATLAKVGIACARTLLVATNDDTENIAVALSARALAPQLWIVARANQDESEAKLRRAGADRVLSPYALGGHRMASLARHPHLEDFVERALRESSFDLRIEDITVTAESPLVGIALPASPAALPASVRDCSIVAICPRGSTAWSAASRRGGSPIGVDDHVIIMGPTEQCQRLSGGRQEAAPSAPASSQ
jgi:voltage-gated potassium channel